MSASARGPAGSRAATVPGRLRRGGCSRAAPPAGTPPPAWAGRARGPLTSCVRSRPAPAGSRPWDRRSRGGRERHVAAVRFLDDGRDLRDREPEVDLERRRPRVHEFVGGQPRIHVIEENPGNGGIGRIPPVEDGAGIEEARGRQSLRAHRGEPILVVRDPLTHLALRGDAVGQEEERKFGVRVGPGPVDRGVRAGRIVEVEVDEARREELARRIDALRPGGDLHLSRGADPLHAVAPHEQRRVLVNGPRAVEDGASLDREPTDPVPRGERRRPACSRERTGFRERAR